VKRGKGTNGALIALGEMTATAVRTRRKSNRSKDFNSFVEGGSRFRGGLNIKMQCVLST
jgi:hypothetical protein